MLAPPALSSRATALALSACLTGALLAAMLALGVDLRLIRREKVTTIELLPLPPLVALPPSAVPEKAKPKPVSPPTQVVPAPIVKLARPSPVTAVATISPATPVAAPSAAALQTDAPISNESRNGSGSSVRDTPVLTPPDAAAFSRDNASPVYPESARRRRQHGTVVISVSVSAEGRVTALKVRDTSGFLVLDEAALVAVRRWRFAPATRGGVPVAAQGYVEVPFVLRRR